MEEIKKYDVRWCKLPSDSKCVLRKTRPCIVISNDKANKTSGTVVVCPLTNVLKRLDLPIHVDLNGRMARMNEYITIHKDDVLEIESELSPYQKRQIDEAILIEFGFI